MEMPIATYLDDAFPRQRKCKLISANNVIGLKICLIFATLTWLSVNVNGQTYFPPSTFDVANYEDFYKDLLKDAVVGGNVEDEVVKVGVTKPLYDFTGKLFKQLVNSRENKSNVNVIISPISIHTALNMLLLGADANSTTKRELMDVIGYGNLSDNKIRNYHNDYKKVLSKFESTNKKTRKVLGKNPKMEFPGGEPRPPIMDTFTMVITKGSGGVLPKYRSNVVKFYHSAIERVEDGADKLLAKLDAWRKRAGFDKPIMTQAELSGPFSAILMSAIYVKAFWPKDILENENEKIFYNDGLMTSEAARDGKTLRGQKEPGWAYLKLSDKHKEAHHHHHHHHHQGSSRASKKLAALNCQVVKMTLSGGLSFTIFEPLEHSTPSDNKLNKLISELFAKSAQSGDEVKGETKLAQVLELLDGPEGDRPYFAVTLPKFKFERELELEETLRAFGMRRAFDPEGAEFSSMTEDKLFVSKVIHQALIEVNEKGIKAAGVTKIVMMSLSTGEGHDKPKIIEVHIKKPFMYLIRYGNIPLFVGQLTRLESGSQSDKEKKRKDGRRKERHHEWRRPPYDESFDPED